MHNLVDIRLKAFSLLSFLWFYMFDKIISSSYFHQLSIKYLRKLMDFKSIITNYFLDRVIVRETSKDVWLLWVVAIKIVKDHACLAFLHVSHMYNSNWMSLIFTVYEKYWKKNLKVQFFKFWCTIQEHYYVSKILSAKLKWNKIHILLSIYTHEII